MRKAIDARQSRGFTLIELLVVIAILMAILMPALSRGTKYYRRIDEVEADGATVHKGTIWAFTIPDYLIVDDFEKYTNDSPNRVFQTWVDGYPFSPDEFFPRGGPGDVSGAGVGHDIWTETSPHYQSATMETAIVAPGSKQSMPFDYNNINSPYYSETDRTWDSPQDWTAGGVDTTRIKKMYIGVVDRNNPKPDGHGVLLIDDIRVIKPASGQQAADRRAESFRTVGRDIRKDMTQHEQTCGPCPRHGPQA